MSAVERQEYITLKENRVATCEWVWRKLV